MAQSRIEDYDVDLDFVWWHYIDHQTHERVDVIFYKKPRRGQGKKYILPEKRNFVAVFKKCYVSLELGFVRSFLLIENFVRSPQALILSFVPADTSWNLLNPFSRLDWR